MSTPWTVVVLTVLFVGAIAVIDWLDRRFK